MILLLTGIRIFAVSYQGDGMKTGNYSLWNDGALGENVSIINYNIIFQDV